MTSTTTHLLIATTAIATALLALALATLAATPAAALTGIEIKRDPTSFLLYGRTSTSYWKPICSTGVTESTARQLCYNMGMYAANGSTSSSVTAQSVSASYWVTGLRCGSTDDTFRSCYYASSTSSSSSCRYGVKLSCGAPYATSANGGVYIAGAGKGYFMRQANFAQNLVQVRKGFSSTWMNICDDYINVDTAVSYCQWLGYSSVKWATWNKPMPAYGSIGLDNVKCPAGASSLSSCSYSTYSNCYRTDSIGVNCNAQNSGTSVGGGMMMRLRPDGRVEVAYSNTMVWGSLCAPAGSLSESTVEGLCKLLGYSYGGDQVNTATADGTGPVWFTNVRCSSSVSLFSSCSKSTPALNSTCTTHSMDLGLKCFASSSAKSSYYSSKRARLSFNIGAIMGPVFSIVIFMVIVGLVFMWIRKRNEARRIDQSYVHGSGNTRFTTSHTPTVSPQTHAELQQMVAYQSPMAGGAGFGAPPPMSPPMQGPGYAPVPQPPPPGVNAYPAPPMQQQAGYMPPQPMQDPNMAAQQPPGFGQYPGYQ